MTAVAAFGLAGCKSRPTAPAPAPAPAAPAAAEPAPSAGAVRSMVEYRRRAAQMIVAANPGASNSGGAQPAQWYGIAVVRIKVNASGGITSVTLDRASQVAPDVNPMALAAVRKVSNFGAAGNLPQPWEFNETFLYDEAKRFQLVTIVENR